MSPSPALVGQLAAQVLAQNGALSNIPPNGSAPSNDKNSANEVWPYLWRHLAQESAHEATLRFFAPMAEPNYRPKLLPFVVN